jgi:N-acetyltransferase
MIIKPVTLVGRRCRLEPLDTRHTRDLLHAGSHGSIWTYLDEPTPSTTTDIARLIDDALDQQRRGQRLPFAIIDTRTGTAVGSTSFLDIRTTDRSLEIGWTWLTPTTWGTGVNQESKYLLLTHAFDTLTAIRVTLKTDARNHPSQRAITKLGATQEGILRNHRILSDGHWRDSIYYSILISEWPRIRSHLAQNPTHHSRP